MPESFLTVSTSAQFEAWLARYHLVSEAVMVKYERGEQPTLSELFTIGEVFGIAMGVVSERAERAREREMLADELQKGS